MKANIRTQENYEKEGVMNEECKFKPPTIGINFIPYNDYTHSLANIEEFGEPVHEVDCLPGFETPRPELS